MASDSRGDNEDPDTDPTEDLTALLDGEHARAQDLQTEAARRYAKGVLSVFRARRRLFGTAGMRGISIERAVASVTSLAALRPDDVPHHVRQDFLRVTLIGRFLQESPNDADLRDYAENLFRLAARLEEYLEEVFGERSE